MLAPSQPVNATSIINKRWRQVDPRWSRLLLINVYVNIQMTESTKRDNNGGLGRCHLAFAVANCILNWRFAAAAATGCQRGPQYDGKCSFYFNCYFFRTTPKKKISERKPFIFQQGKRALFCRKLSCRDRHI